MLIVAVFRMLGLLTKKFETATKDLREEIDGFKEDVKEILKVYIDFFMTYGLFIDRAPLKGEEVKKG